jgi:D-lactate dehydrogenase
MMKITFLEIQGFEKSFLTKNLKNHDLFFSKENISEIDFKKIEKTEVLSVFIYSKLDKSILQRLPNLKLITTRSTGFDHVDLEYCRQRKIEVCNVPFYGENTVAEHTFALILALSRNVHKSYIRSINNNFSIEGLAGFDLKGKTIGIVGAGHIGLHVIRIAKGFGMEVLAFDPFRNTFLDDLLKKSDIITLHVPYNEKTHHLINKEKISLIKKGSILINTSRGGIIDTEALITALESKQIAGCGLDVLEGEELIMEEKELLYNKDPNKLQELFRDKMLINHENVVFTPHIAFYSQEALQRIIQTTLNNIQHFISNGSVLNSVK